jgi:hypothetical protein
LYIPPAYPQKGIWYGSVDQEILTLDSDGRKLVAVEVAEEPILSFVGGEIEGQLELLAAAQHLLYRSSDGKGWAVEQDFSPYRPVDIMFSPEVGAARTVHVMTLGGLLWEVTLSPS